jgi:hypothetical protein
MSDTPETDAAVEASGGDWSPVLRAVAQRLERERDEWAAMCGRYKQERDEAREERDSLKQELEIVTARLHGKKHPLDNGIPERHEVYIWKNGKYELDP